MKLLLLLLTALPLIGSSGPNVLWIYVDDMSDWFGCYGRKVVPTPHIDALAAKGTRFERAYMPAPVCSSTRSALITGMMQTSLGLHQHRTMIKKPLPNGIFTVPTHFRRAGYVTFNEAKDTTILMSRALLSTRTNLEPKDIFQEAWNGSHSLRESHFLDKYS